jgi:hypothetical protein
LFQIVTDPGSGPDRPRLSTNAALHDGERAADGASLIEQAKTTSPPTQPGKTGQEAKERALCCGNTDDFASWHREMDRNHEGAQRAQTGAHAAKGNIYASLARTSNVDRSDSSSNCNDEGRVPSRSPVHAAANPGGGGGGSGGEIKSASCPADSERITNGSKHRREEGSARPGEDGAVNGDNDIGAARRKREGGRSAFPPLGLGFRV